MKKGKAVNSVLLFQSLNHKALRKLKIKTSFTEKDLIKKLYRIPKSEIEEIRELALSDEDFMKMLIKISLSNEERSNWRAAWVINHITTENREKIIPFIITRFTPGHHVTVAKRALVRLEK